MSTEHQRRLQAMLRQVAPQGQLESVSPQWLNESAGNQSSLDFEMFAESAAAGVQAIKQDKDLAPDQQFALEAIVMPRFRPVVDIVADSFDRPASPWEHFGDTPIRQRISSVLTSIGRIELPGHPSLPFAGTGFVVGSDLIMTNRHVAEIFAIGLGTRRLAFRPQSRAGIDFVREIKDRASIMLDVKDVVMIHPHWDMALLRVLGLAPSHPKLTLSVTPRKNFSMPRSLS